MHVGGFASSPPGQSHSARRGRVRSRPGAIPIASQVQGAIPLRGSAIGITEGSEVRFQVKIAGHSAEIVATVAEA